MLVVLFSSKRINWRKLIKLILKSVNDIDLKKCNFFTFLGKRKHTFALINLMPDIDVFRLGMHLHQYWYWSLTQMPSIATKCSDTSTHNGTTGQNRVLFFDLSQQQEIVKASLLICSSKRYWPIMKPGTSWGPAPNLLFGWVAQWQEMASLIYEEASPTLPNS